MVAEQDLSIANGQASLPLNNLKGDSAYYALSRRPRRKARSPTALSKPNTPAATAPPR
ncbi:MAG: hypothetical protein ACLRMR_09000 [Bifidobacterium pseudocatenulatum]